MNTITLTNEQYQALQNGESITIEPPKTLSKWEPSHQPYTVMGNGSILKNRYSSDYRFFGTSYSTQQAAEKARDAMRTHNRLLAWVAENDDGWEADWNDFYQGKYSIYYDIIKEKYDYVALAFTCEIASVRMSEQNANKLCKLLNNGIVIL